MSEFIVPDIGDVQQAPGVVTACDLIDRVFNEYLYPAGVNRPQTDVLAGDINAVIDSLTTQGRVRDFPPNAIIEIGDELAITGTVSGVDVPLLERGYLESVAETHTAGEFIRVKPEFHRITVFNALRTVIGMLYPWNIYRVGYVDSFLFTSRTPFTLGSNVKRILSVRVKRQERWGPMLEAGRDYEVMYDAAVPELQMFRGGGEGAEMRIAVGLDFTKPGVCSDTLDVPLNVQGGLPMAVAGVLLQGREIQRLNMKEIRDILAAQGAQIPPGATFNVSQALIGTFRQVFVDAERNRLLEQFPTIFEYVR